MLAKDNLTACSFEFRGFNFFFEGSEVSIIVISLKSTWQSELNFHMASLRLKLQRWLGMSHSLFLKFPVELYFLVLTK
jgi:hypothetical protein